MGQDKATVLLDGEPLAARMLRVLIAGGCASATLVGNLAALDELGPVLREPEGPYHPLRGVAAALAACASPLLLIAPCDLVSLQPEHIAALLAVGGPCVARADGRVHPLLAVIATDQAARAAGLADIGASARALTADLVPVDLPPGALLDANRPEDLPRSR